MKLRCPSCGGEIDFDTAVRGTDGEALAKAAAMFGRDWELVSEYLDGFRARRDAALALKKRLRLLREIWEMWSACRFIFDGQEYEVGREEFRAALAQVSNRELTGLKNHNYLKQVLKVAAREYSKRAEAARLDREKGLGKRAEERLEDLDPEIPKLVNRALFGRTDEERAAAKAELERRKEKQCKNTN